MNNPPDNEPSLMSQAANLAGAIGRIGVAAATGGRVLVSNAEVASRVATCESNECGAFNQQKRACNWCGCFINQKAKYATEVCGEAEFALRNNKTGYNWWTGETVKPDLTKPNTPPIVQLPPQVTPTTEPTATEPKPRVEGTVSTLYVTGSMILEHEAALRLILPTDGETVKRFNEYHQALSSPSGCTSCRRNGFIRAIELAIQKDFTNHGSGLVEKVKSVFPESKYISAPTPTAWDVLLKR